jgi:lipopolysaccharide export system protein LptC
LIGASLSAAGLKQTLMMVRNGHGTGAAGPVRPAPARLPGYRRARVVSWALFGLAAALAAVFVVHIARFEATAPSRPDTEATAPVSNQIVVTRSTLTGFDDDRLPYSVTAASAVQDTAEPNRVHLEMVAAELHRRSGDVLGLAARTALYDSKTEVLQLVGDVTLVTAGRFVARMARAEVTLSDKRLRSQSPVDVTFDRGEITAGGLEITDDGNRVVFLNRARVTFGPQTKGDMEQ